MADQHGQGSMALFAPVRFYIIESETLPRSKIDQISEMLVQHGAEAVSKLDLDEITHIIATTVDFPEYESIIDVAKAVVKPDWVTSSMQKNKLANTRQYSPDPRHFFSGVIVTCADLPPGDCDAITGGVLAAGGLHSVGVTKMVTHIVALTLDNDKCQLVLDKKLKCKIVLPHWFDDCLKLGQRIDEAPYCLPDPDILKQGSAERVVEIQRNDVSEACTTNPARPPTPTESACTKQRELSVFKGKKVMLSEDLDISIHLRNTLEELVSNGGGSISGTVGKSDLFICQYRESLAYRIASRAGKDVGNLSWLYYLINHNTWTSPLRRLLHYPVSRAGLPGFDNFRISLSNYNGDARLLLENLAKAAGGEFTKTMKEDNTHLITAHTVSEKCDAAREWNIHMVNHLWLEESYAKWTIQSVSNPRYTTFPQRTNLTEVVGHTPIDKKAVERFFFPPGSDIDRSESSKAMLRKDPNVNTAKSGEKDRPRRGEHDATTPKSSRASGATVNEAKYRTPAVSRFAQGKENETPSTTGSRSAKDKAAAKLHDMASDILAFQKESKRVGGVIHGGRRRPEDRVKPNDRKRSFSNDEEDDAASDVEARDGKRPKKQHGFRPPVMRLILSGYKRWVGSTRQEADEKDQLRNLGIAITNDPADCTHLACPNILRTQKFICSLAYAPIVLSTDFVEDCLRKDELLDTADYLLRDTQGEVRHNTTVIEILERARLNQGRLFQGYRLYCTDTVHGGFETYRQIAEANGTTCLLYRARSTVFSSETDSESQDSRVRDYIYLITGTTPEQAKLWPKFRQMAHESGKQARVLRYDWMLDAALTQRFGRFEDYLMHDQDV